MTAHSRHPARPSLAPWLLGCAVWCLVIALAVGGWQTVAVRMLGTSHHHRDAHDQGARNVLLADAAAMAGWQDFRRAGHLPHRAPAEHMVQQRHHHGAGDASIVALDAVPDATARADSTQAGSDGAVLMLALGSCTPRAAPATQHWPPLEGAALPRPHPDRLERPPQA